MAQTTSIHVKPCNIGSSEAHNRRSAEYLAHINKDRIYIRTDLSGRNSAWTNPDLEDNTLAERYDQIRLMVKEKTGREMQTADRERVNKKTGKKITVRGSTPIKEGVVVIGEDTTMQQLQKFCAECRERWGITALQIFIHRDEGHCEDPQHISSWKANHHAHIVWDWMDHETGKSLKLNANDMSDMQTLLAECLDMERGVSKEMTDRRHLDREDYIIAKQQEKAEQARADRDSAIADKEVAEKERTALKNENAEMARKLAEERKGKRDDILDRVGSLVGVGKTAELKQENADLKAELGRIKEAFPKAVEKEVRKRTEPMARERDAALRKADNAVMQGQIAAAEKDDYINRLHGKLNSRMTVLQIFADILYSASELFKRAIDAIVELATNKFKAIFEDSQAADIKNVMQQYGETEEEQKAIGDWMCDYANTLQTADRADRNKAYAEVMDVAEGRYDHIIDRTSGMAR